MSDALHQQQFLNVIDRDEAERRFREALDLTPLDTEVVSLDLALGRTLADTVISPVDVPGFDRSNVDGFAVRAEDTFGASEDARVDLQINAEEIRTGIVPGTALSARTATAISTGGMLPRGADSVVKIEHTTVRHGKLMIQRPVAPGAHVSFAGCDVSRGEEAMNAGQLLSSRDLAIIAAVGMAAVKVIRRPRVAILSTGDEIIAPGEPPRIGCVYDSNSAMLHAAVRELGGEPVSLGIVSDDLQKLEAALRAARDQADMIVLSGGTSKGAGDVSYRAVGNLGSPGIIVHGVALKPGKPLCLAAFDRPGRRRAAIAVLPGFPASAMFTFHEFLAPIIRAWAGRRADRPTVVQAHLPMRVNSDRGRTEYLLVSLIEREVGASPRLSAYPIGKGSGSVTEFSRADGFIAIPRQREYIDADEVVDVHLLTPTVHPADLTAIGSHCIGLDLLLTEMRAAGFTTKFLAVGSMGGLEAVGRGECDLAGIHLLDPATDRYNEPFLAADMELIRGYGRLQGLVFRPGDKRFDGKTVESATAAALADCDCVMVNRNRGSGTRVLIDRLLNGERPVGYSVEARSHNAVAAAIVQGRADWGVAIEPVARSAGLGFIPICDEQYDFVVPRARMGRPAIQFFRKLLTNPDVRAKLTSSGFSSG